MCVCTYAHTHTHIHIHRHHQGMLHWWAPSWMGVLGVESLTPTLWSQVKHPPCKLYSRSFWSSSERLTNTAWYAWVSLLLHTSWQTGDLPLTLLCISVFIDNCSIWQIEPIHYKCTSWGTDWFIQVAQISEWQLAFFLSLSVLLGMNVYTSEPHNELHAFCTLV